MTDWSAPSEQLLGQMMAIRVQCPGDWSAIAECLETLRQRENWPPGTRKLSEVMERAAEACGWEAGYLKRALACRTFLASAPAPQGLPVLFGQQKTLADLLVGDRLPSVTAVEHMKALHLLSPMAAQALAHAALSEDGRITTPRAKRALDDFRKDARKQIVSAGGSQQQLPSADGRARQVDFEILARSQIALAPELFAPGIVRVLAEGRLRRSAYVAPDLILVAEEPVRLVAIEIRSMPRRLPLGRLREFLGQIVLSATYFEAFWLVLDSAETGAWLAGHFRALDERSIGIAVAHGDHIVPILCPTGKPRVDRRDAGKRMFSGLEHGGRGGRQGDAR